MRAVFAILSFVCLVLAEDFITKTEYAKMLYLNPRGIGCDKCHGKNGEGSLISKFKYINKKTKELSEGELRAPAITNVSKERFNKAISKPKSVMPRYFLTDDENAILYEYIISLDKTR